MVGQPGSGVRAGAAEEFLRSDIYADPGSVDSCVGRAAGVRGGDLPRTTAAGAHVLVEGPEQAGLAGGAAQGHHVLCGRKSRNSTGAWLVGVSKLLLNEAKVAVLRGSGLGIMGRACAVSR